MTQVLGERIPYGNLLAYCFRRFGYPNVAWDGDKDLAAYMLTTPREDLLMRVEPHVSEWSALSVRFFVPEDVKREITRFSRRGRVEWRQRALAWAAQEGLPHWMLDWCDYYRDEFCPAFGLPVPPDGDWRSFVEVLAPMGEEGSRLHTMTSRIAMFNEQVHRGFAHVEPPPSELRSADWREWPADDPLRVYAEAVEVALKDLKRPVLVRDEVIDALGRAAPGEFGAEGLAERARSAGYPAGAPSNIAPAAVAKLQAFISRFSSDDIAGGYEMALGVLKEAAACR